MKFLWRLTFVFCPLFWHRLWTEGDTANEPIWFKLWLTFVVAAVIVFVVGLAALVIWAWPPIALILVGILVGIGIGESRWWSKLNQ